MVVLAALQVCTGKHRPLPANKFSSKFVDFIESLLQVDCRRRPTAEIFSERCLYHLTGSKSGGIPLIRLNDNSTGSFLNYIKQGLRFR